MCNTVWFAYSGAMSSEDVPRLVSLAWGLAVAPQRGPKRELSHERIVEAAVELADAEGLGAVTMQRVAQGFGFTTMALYRYVASKDDLHQLMLDAVTAPDAWAIDDADWRMGLSQWVRVMSDAYSRHLWALDIELSGDALLMPGHMKAANAGLRAMRGLSATPAEKVGILMTLSVLVRGLAGVRREIDSVSGGPSAATVELIRAVVADAGLVDIGAVIEDGTYFGGEIDTDEDDVEVAWQLVAAGIERQWGAGSASPEPPSPPDSPEHRLAAAEAALADTVALRKATQRQAQQLEKQEARARARRDEAKAALKAALRAR